MVMLRNTAFVHVKIGKSGRLHCIVFILYLFYFEFSFSWDVSDPTKETYVLFSYLKPYTQYAFYVKTLTISTERRNAQSPIQWFMTKADQPKSVEKVMAYANTSSNIVINWQPPSTANGKLIRYRVRAIYDKRIQRIDSRNYCNDRKYNVMITQCNTDLLLDNF